MPLIFKFINFFVSGVAAITVVAFTPMGLWWTLVLVWFLVSFFLAVVDICYFLGEM